MLYQQEKVSEIWDDIEPLFLEHFREVDFYQDLKLDIDKESYLRIEESGMLRVYTVRDEEGTVVGYADYFINHSLHHKSVVHAYQDGIYLKKKYRGVTGYKLIQFCLNQLQMDGVNIAYAPVKKEHDFSPMLERMGFELIEMQYGRRLQ